MPGLASRNDSGFGGRVSTSPSESTTLIPRSGSTSAIRPWHSPSSRRSPSAEIRVIPMRTYLPSSEYGSRSTKKGSAGGGDTSAVDQPDIDLRNATYGLFVDLGRAPTLEET